MDARAVAELALAAFEPAPLVPGMDVAEVDEAAHLERRLVRGRERGQAREEAEGPPG